MRAVSLTPGYLRFAASALRLSRVPRQLVSDAAGVADITRDRTSRVCVAASVRAPNAGQAANRPPGHFPVLLQIYAGDTTTNLLRARAGYVAELYSEKPDLDAEIAELAKLHHDLITAELDRNSTVSVPTAASPQRESRRLIPK